MSRGYNARQKAKRQQARAVAAPARRRRSKGSKRRLVTLVPVLVIAAILATVGVLGFGASSGTSKEQVEREVTALLDGIPQKGTILGSPGAPITLRVFADLECPTVKVFVEKYLPSIIDTWVRDGTVRLDYRSLETDTVEEKTFFRQEIAALAAGRQDRLWNFALTFVREQGDARTDYATDEFLTDIASQVPDLKQAQWRRDRDDPLLSEQVALSVYRAHLDDVGGTPSFQVGYSSGKVDRRFSSDDKASIQREVEASLGKTIAALINETSGDVPTLGGVDSP